MYLRRFTYLFLSLEKGLLRVRRKTAQQQENERSIRLARGSDYETDTDLRCKEDRRMQTNENEVMLVVHL
jgi:hypothetical protein